MQSKATSRSIAVIVAITMIFTIFTAVTGIGSLEASAASEQTVNKQATIKNGPLTVRSGPGTSYKKLGTVAKGKTIKVLKQTTNSKGEKWYKYQYSSSKQGYVLAKYVTLKSSSSSYTLKEFTRKAIIKNGPLTIRSGPGTTYSKLGTIAKGKAFFIKKKATLTSGKVWYQFSYNGKTGYVLSDYVSLTEIVSETAVNQNATITNGPLNVRSGASTSDKKLGTVAKGKTIKVLSKAKNTSGEEWYEFQYTSSKVGYVLSDYVKLSNISSETVYKRKAIVQKNSLPVRSGPGGSYSKLGSLSKNKEIFVNQKVKLITGTIWYRITYNSKTAYVHGSYLKMTDIVSETSCKQKGVINADSLNVRKGPGTSYGKLGTVKKGKSISVTKKVETTSGTWYGYQYSNSQMGYVSSEYVKISGSNGSNLTSAEFETWMTEQGFPSSYKSRLRTLHKAHPEWIFKAYKVGTTWSKAVSKEMANPYNNVVYKTQPKSYRSNLASVKNNPVEGGWYAANEKVVKYYMDSRNFLNEDYIYQFMVQTYDGNTQNATTVASVVKGTFMETRKTGSSTYPTYAKLINAVGKETGINPNVLAAMIRQEQGAKGTSALISGTYPGYKGYYNFFNVRATGGSTTSVIVNGLKYAKQVGWNSVYKSIKGGAKFYGENYILQNQDTFYTKKFNVKNGLNNIGMHQYMTNVAGGASEGRLMKQALSKDDYAIVFEIPVYSSMPSSACKLP